MSLFAGLDPRLRPYAQAFFDLLREHGANPIVTSTRRSSATQARLYRRYLAGLHPFPVAPPGRSLHEHGLAWDMKLAPGWAEVAGPYWEQMGGTWGGRFRDPIHFDARVLR